MIHSIGRKCLRDAVEKLPHRRNSNKCPIYVWPGLLEGHKTNIIATIFLFSLIWLISLQPVYGVEIVGWIKGGHCLKYNHANRISLSCYEHAFWTWPLYEWSVKVSTTHSAVEISRKPPPPFPDTHTPR